jgi:hypothetical protein
MTAGGDIRLSDADLLAAWEAGAGATPVARAVAVAACAAPSERVDQWSVGRRDALLLDVHAAAFGNAFELVTDCPACGEALELTLTVGDVRSSWGDAGAEHELTDEASGVRLAFRLPSSADLLAVAAIDDAAAARLALAERCVAAAERGGAPVETLPESAIAALGARIAELDPQADLDLALACGECGQLWTAPLDVADHVWRRIDARARSLVADVAALAAAFGWTEGEILGLSADRRRLYLDLVGA